jgi:hypothetical protein
MSQMAEFVKRLQQALKCRAGMGNLLEAGSGGVQILRIPASFDNRWTMCYH